MNPWWCAAKEPTCGPLQTGTTGLARSYLSTRLSTCKHGSSPRLKGFLCLYSLSQGLRHRSVYLRKLPKAAKENWGHTAAVTAQTPCSWLPEWMRGLPCDIRLLYRPWGQVPRLLRRCRLEVSPQEGSGGLSRPLFGFSMLLTHYRK